MRRATTLDGGRLVRAEVDAGAAAHQGEDVAERRRVLLGRRAILHRDVRVAAQPHQLLGEPRDGHRAVDHARVDRGARHAGKLRRHRILHEGDAVGGLDGPQPLGAI